MMPCPKCQQPLDYVEAMKELVEIHEDAFKDAWPRFINVWCDTCEDMTVSIWIEPNNDGREIETTGDWSQGKDISLRFPKGRM
jgi:hypothetical protein